MIVANGKNGRVSFDQKLIYISKSGGVGLFLNQGIQGDRTIVARHITAVEFREPGKGTNGFIAFDFPGKSTPKGGVFDAAADENAVIFLHQQRDEFAALKDSIVSYLAQFS